MEYSIHTSINKCSSFLKELLNMNALNLKITGDTKKKGRKREAKEDLSPFYNQHESCRDVLDSLSAASSMESQISTIKSIIVSSIESGNANEVSNVITLSLDLILQLNVKSPLRAAILRHFLTSLKKLVSDFSIEIAPTAKLQVIEALHSNVRCLISIFQKAACEPSSELQQLVLALLKDEQLPLDTRSNCGILYVSYCKALSSDFEGKQIIDNSCAPDDFQSLLCMCGGLLNTLSGEDLAKTVLLHREESSILNYLLYKIILVEESNPADCTLVLSASRCVLLVTKSVVATPHLLTKDMLSTILNFVWIHLEHYMDAVRHLATSSLFNVVLAGEKLEDKFVFDMILNEVSLMASDRRSKHAAISALIGNLPIQNLLMKCPGLIEALLDSAKTSPAVNHAIGSYEALMAQHFKEKTNMEEWYDWWVNPLISALGDRPNAAFDHILGAIVKLDPSVILYIARLQSSDPDRLTSIFLICLRIGRKLGVLKDDDDSNKWKGVIDYDWLAKHVYHLNGDVRIACFALITETQKLSEEFCSRELDIVKLFLKYNINNHCAAERQKTMAYCKKKLLAEVPLEVLRFNVPEYVSWYIESSARLAASIRPVDSQSAAYYISLLASFPSAGNLLLSLYPDVVRIQTETDVSKIPDIARYVCVAVILDKLKNELETAQQSLLKAASSGPLYGQLFVLRHILKDADFDLLVNSEEWKTIIEELITVAYECNHVVASVVNSSSPEGHLPMDFDYDIKALGHKEDVPKVTSQMLLLCSWRTVKEVSLLLGELSESVPISICGDPGLITEERVLEIGEHLSGLLAETKHRGAFEQAYVGFCKLASRLWRYPKGNLHELPGRWLDETLEEISSNQNLTATRRSAGIPFRIQGLVCTELEVGGGKCFHRGIKTLMKLANDPTNSVETKCHALNILRALYRHTLLGEMVSPYVAEGLSIAIQGFNASTWAERNSSTLLLSALMTRVFGVPRSRSENLCWKNKMTGRIFFQRYPSLFGVLLNHLETASQKSLYPATYPALLILGRLYPSSLEGTDSNLQLNKYIPLVFKCSGSNILKTRTLAASAMVALITPNLFVSHIEEVFNALAGSLSENFTHGLLLQILKLFRASSDLPGDVMESVMDNLGIWLAHVIQALKSPKRSCITKTACVSILLHWITHYFKNVPNDCIRNIKDSLTNHISSNDSDFPSQFGKGVFLLYSATLLLTINYYRQKLSDMIKCIIMLLKHSTYDVRNVTLDFLRCVLQDSKCFSLKVDDASNIEFQSSNFKEKLRDLIVKSDEIAQTVMSSLDQNYHHEDAVALLSVIPYLPKVFVLLKSKSGSTIQYFGELCEDRPDSLGCLAFECISSSMSHAGVNYELESSETDRLCRLIDSYSLPDCENSCRSCVAAFLTKHFDFLVDIGSPRNNLTIWTSTLRLLNDDDCDIRETLAGAFSVNTVPVVAVEKFIEKLIESSSVDDVIKGCLLLQWSTWDCNEENDDDDESIDRVFDKGDMNTYLEDFTVTSISSRYLASFIEVHSDVLTKDLPDFCCSWITNESQLPLTGSTLKDIIASAKTSIVDRSLSIANSSPHSGSFSPIFRRTFGVHQLSDVSV
ncbi:hypothetical protein GE061_012319 [Apolygus lucorum]|uniref:tRNA (32-2'-O)-methyltransferase regulator THADA n=1 Tax=Apolygus lucorum TaxID=248454 RepID=A0A8S9XT61_APOLU|nr:hypothetical protein GE061_012319 [Apolygus lucorum]